MLNDGAWNGHSVVVVGGGPSLRGFDWELLRGKRIIAINRAYISVPWADVFFTEDLRFVKKFSTRDDWRDFKGRKVVHCLDESFDRQFLDRDPSIHLIRRRPRREARCWSHSLEHGLSYASNSGIGAINLADILGGDPIYLLGFDCRVSADKQSNYHSDYEKNWRTGHHQYGNFLRDMIHWVKPHLRHRKVFNVVNRDCPSAIPDEIFPWMNAEDLWQKS